MSSVIFFLFFFPCIAGRVRDMAGQQLEILLKLRRISCSVSLEVKNKKNQEQTNTKPNKTHPPTTTKSDNTAREFAKLGETSETTRPSQPLIGSLPPCSTPSSHPRSDVGHIYICTSLLRRVSYVWLQPTSLELL